MQEISSALCAEIFAHTAIVLESGLQTASAVKDDFGLRLIVFFQFHPKMRDYHAY